MKDNNSDDAVRIKLDLVEIRVNLRHAEAKILEKTQELEKVHTNFSQRDGELKRTIQELNNLNTIYEVTKEKLKQAEAKISQKEKNDSEASGYSGKYAIFIVSSDDVEHREI